MYKIKFTNFNSILREICLFIVIYCTWINQLNNYIFQIKIKWKVKCFQVFSKDFGKEYCI